MKETQYQSLKGVERKNDTIICDSCHNYQVHPSGVIEICQAQKQGSVVIAWLDDDYRDKRFCGDAKKCKGYKRIQN